eukprot:scaffold836_cov147-Skeletonema_menzelii.AAC.1
MKEEQLKAGIDAAYQECAKMTEQLVTPGLDKPWAFTLIMYPKYGPTILRVAIAIAKEKGFNVDTIRDGEGDLVDDELEWGTFLADERDDTYRSFLDKWRCVGDDVVHWLQQLGLMTSKVRNELKRLTQETVVIRDVNSSTRLKDFADSYPEIFDMFWSKMGLYPHSTRIVEQSHGMERHGYNSQASNDFRDARTNYMVLQEYENRRDRRGLVLARAAEKALSTTATATATAAAAAAATATTATATATKRKKKQNVKHNDRKPTQKMGGDQLLEASRRYTTESITARTTESFQKEYSISSIAKRGTNVGKKQLDEKKVAHAEAIAARKRQSTTYSQTSLEDQIKEAETLETANDLAWKSRDAIEIAKRLDK